MLVVPCPPYGVYWSKYQANDPERWLSGRKQRFAKASYGLNRTEGSNPYLSAKPDSLREIAKIGPVEGRKLLLNSYWAGCLQ